jgi:hypothetical protein
MQNSQIGQLLLNGHFPLTHLLTKDSPIKDLLQCLNQTSYKGLITENHIKEFQASYPTYCTPISATIVGLTNDIKNEIRDGAPSLWFINDMQLTIALAMLLSAQYAHDLSEEFSYYCSNYATNQP